MIKAFGQSSPEIAAYAESTFSPMDAVLSEIRSRAQAKGLPAIHVGAMDGLHLEILARMSGAKRAVEVGTLAGYSGVCLLRGMGAGSKLYTIDADKNHTEVARESFSKAGFSNQVDLRVGPGTRELPKLESFGPFDLMFIDADKVGYPDYAVWAEKNLRPGGLLIADNTFGFGMIADSTFEDPEDEATVKALRVFNEKLARSKAWRATILPTAEGLTVAVKV